MAVRRGVPAVLETRLVETGSLVKGALAQIFDHRARHMMPVWLPGRHADSATDSFTAT